MLKISIQRLLFCILVLVPNIAVSQHVDIVRYNISKHFSDPKQSYYIDLLQLALSASKTKYGNFELKPVVIEMPQGRTSIMVAQHDSIDVVWRMTSIEIEEQLSAIYIPIIKGIMGNRIFIIRQGEQKNFPKDIDKKPLQKMLAGQGHDWPDSEILRDNGFNVATANASLLLEMLERKRFDYFPRALHEPWIEVEGHLQLAVEKNIVLQYPAPMFYFVNKDNKRLHQRIQFGLSQLMRSGEFERFFQHHKVTKDILSKADLPHRKKFKLSNPLLSEKAKSALKKFDVNL